MRGKLPDYESTDDEERNGWSVLSNKLLNPGARNDDRGANLEKFLCEGGRVWLGEEKGAACSRPLRAVLINATNVHYAKVKSSLWIPPSESTDTKEKLRVQLDSAKFRPEINILRSFGDTDEEIADRLIKKYSIHLASSKREDIIEALSLGSQSPAAELPDGLSEEEFYRYPEYRQLQEACSAKTTKDFLEIRLVESRRLTSPVANFIKSISLIDKLRETRVMAGFSRLLFESPDSDNPQNLMWKSLPRKKADRWLPATYTIGEGVFFKIKNEILDRIDASPVYLKLVRPIQERENAAARRTARTAKEISPRFVLLHTLAHLMVRRLVFECGYGSASLRERLYVSTNDETKMGGILIYTASGDCEGSLGGLVKMGEPQNFERIFLAALEESRWCSADPVCSESANQGGQGVDGLNSAACHCCTLLPETCCEEFNSYLDRNLVNKVFAL